MKNLIYILVSARQEDDLAEFRALLADLPGAEVRSRLLPPEVHDPLAGNLPEPDILVHCLGPAAREELLALAARPGRLRPVAVIVHRHGEMNPGLIRLALQAGARDFIVGAAVPEDTLAAVRKILKEKLAESAGSVRPLTAIVNAKGGAGASTVAGNLAHLLAGRRGLRTALLDLDMQFGSQTLQFDLHPDQGLLDALAAAEVLDEIALSAFMAKHAGGLHVLGRLGDQLLLPGEVPEKHFDQLLELSQRAYQQVVVDLPRLVDPVFNRVMERATAVFIVLQQQLSHLRDGKRLLRILAHELDVRPELIHIVVNRYDARVSIGLADVQRTLDWDNLSSIPNDYKNFSAAGNLGIPLLDYAPNSPGARALLKLSARLCPAPEDDKAGLLRKLISCFDPGA